MQSQASNQEKKMLRNEGRNLSIEAGKIRKARNEGMNEGVKKRMKMSVEPKQGNYLWLAGSLTPGHYGDYNSFTN